MTPSPCQIRSTPSRGLKAVIALDALMPIKKIASQWYVSGSSPKWSGLSSTTALTCAAVSTSTLIGSWSRPKSSTRTDSICCPSLRAGFEDRSSTLPVARTVETFSWPRSVNRSDKADMASLFLPPTFTPRSSARYDRLVGRDETTDGSSQPGSRLLPRCARCRSSLGTGRWVGSLPGCGVAGGDDHSWVGGRPDRSGRRRPAGPLVRETQLAAVAACWSASSGGVLDRLRRAARHLVRRQADAARAAPDRAAAPRRRRRCGTASERDRPGPSHRRHPADPVLTRSSGAGCLGSRELPVRRPPGLLGDRPRCGLAASRVPGAPRPCRADRSRR